jgi:hypothetical protein
MRFLSPAASLPVLALLGSVASPALADSVQVDVDVDVNVETTPGQPVVIAEPVLVPAPPPHPRLLRGHRWEASVLLEGGGFAVGDISGGQFGVRGVLARQLGPLRIAVEGSLAKLSGSRDLYTSDGWWMGWEDHGGEVRRIGAAVRYRAAGSTQLTPGGPRGALGGYIEAGIGRQYLAWTGGGAAERADYMLGAGFEIVGGSGRMGGMDLGVRVLASPSMDPTDATHDLGVLVSLGATFGSR